MPKLKVIEPIYQRTYQGGIMKVGYKLFETLTDKDGRVIKSVLKKLKMYV